MKKKNITNLLIRKVRRTANLGKAREKQIVKEIKRITGEKSNIIRKRLKEVTNVNKQQKVIRKIKRQRSIRTSTGEFRAGYKQKLINFVNRSRNVNRAKKQIDKLLVDLRQGKLSRKQFSKLTNIPLRDIPQSQKTIDLLTNYSDIDNELYEDFYDLIIQSNRERKLGLASGPASTQLKKDYSIRRQELIIKKEQAYSDIVISTIKKSFK